MQSASQQTSTQLITALMQLVFRFDLLCCADVDIVGDIPQQVADVDTVDGIPQQGADVDVVGSITQQGSAQAAPAAIPHHMSLQMDIVASDDKQLPAQTHLPAVQLAAEASRDQQPTDQAHSIPSAQLRTRAQQLQAEAGCTHLSNQQATDQAHSIPPAQLHTHAQQLKAEAGCTQLASQRHTDQAHSMPAAQLRTHSQQLQAQANCMQGSGSSASASNAVLASQQERSGSHSTHCTDLALTQKQCSRSQSAPCSAQIADAHQVVGRIAQCLQQSSESNQVAKPYCKG